jgi:hypothetical protein
MTYPVFMTIVLADGSEVPVVTPASFVQERGHDQIANAKAALSKGKANLPRLGSEPPTGEPSRKAQAASVASRRPDELAAPTPGHWRR